MQLSSSLLTLVSLVLLSSPSLHAATYTWISSSSGDWNNAANWSPGAPVNGSTNNALLDTVNLTSDLTLHLNVSSTLNSLTFGDAAPSGHHWIVDNNGNPANKFTLGGAVPAITVNNLGAGAVTFGAELTGIAGLRKNGTGALIISGDNSSLSGGSTLVAGSLGFGHDNALGTSSLSISASTSPSELFAANGARVISNAVSLPNNNGFATIGGRENLTLSGQVTHVTGGGNIGIWQVNNSGLTSFSGGWALNNRVHVGGTGDLLVNSTVTVGGASGLYMYGQGTLSLTGAYNATSTLRADSGTVRVNNLASTAVTLGLSGGELQLDLNGFSSGVWNSGSNLSSGGGGTLLVKGASSGSSTQTLNSLTFSGGHTNLIIDPGIGSGTTLNVTTAAWTRSGGSTVSVDLSLPGATMTASPTLTNGIAGYAVVRDSSGIGFLTRTSGGSGPDIARYTGAATLAANSNSATTNFQIQPASTTPFNWNGVANRSVNSLAIDTSTSGGVLDLGGSSNVLTITSRGLLMTGANDYLIQNGQVGSGAAELIVHQYGSGVLTIAGTAGATTGSLTKSGTGTLALTGTNSYTGATTITNGALRATDGAGLPSASVLQLRGGVLESSGTFTRTLGTAAGNLNFGGAHAGAGGGFAAYGGTFAIQLNGGTGPIAWSDSDLSTTTVLNNAQILVLGSVTANAMVDFQNSLVLNSAANASRTREIRVIDNLAVSTDIARMSGVISDGGANDGIVKTGNGVLELTGTNTYRGATTIRGGTLRVADLTDGGTAGNLGQSTNAASNLVIHGGALQYTGSGATTDRRFSVGTGGATIDASGTGALVFSNPGAVSLDAVNTAGSYGARTLTLAGSNPGNNTLAATVADQGGATSLVKNGAGKWVLTGVSSYSGSTTVNGGTFVVSGSASINSTSAIAVSAGVLDYQGAAGLSRNVTVNGGTFKYNSSAAYSGSLTLNSGTIGGSGNMSGTALSIGTGVTLSPGNSPGTAHTGAQTWGNGGAYLWEINALATSGTPGSEGSNPGWDFADINGALTITAGTGQFILNVDSLLALDNWNASSSYQWRIASATLGVSGFDPAAFNIMTGSFSDENSIAGGTFSVTNIGNDVYLNYTAVPEPGSVFLVYFGLGTIWLLGSRRRSRRDSYGVL